VKKPDSPSGCERATGAARHNWLSYLHCAGPSSLSPARSGTPHPILGPGTLSHSPFHVIPPARARHPTRVPGEKPTQIAGRPGSGPTASG